MRIRRLLARIGATALIATSLTTVTAATQIEPAAAAAPSIAVRLVKGGLNGPAAFTFSPRGLIFYAERGTGEIHVWNPNTHTDRLVYTISGVNGDGERGALGVALHPGWPERPFIFVYVTRMVSGVLRNQVLRIRVDNGHGVSAREIFQTSAVTVLYHNGGRILFGPGGSLYAMVGDGHDSGNAQDRTSNPRGKILRMTTSGAAAKGNPFRNSRIWSFGHRNSFGFTFDPLTGRLWETENGPECNDEINLDVKGGNFGWGPNENCSGTSPGDTNNSGPRPRLGPKWFSNRTIGITGAAFCHRCGLPPRFEGDLFFGGVNAGQLRVLHMNGARNGSTGGANAILTAPNGAILSMETSPNGQIYFSDFSGIYKLVSA
jgi:glucose/arabinose dehydrogenase